jgi:hypothetical protein
MFARRARVKPYAEGSLLITPTTFPAIWPDRQASMIACRLVPLPLIRTTIRHEILVSVKNDPAGAVFYLSKLVNCFAGAFEDLFGVGCILTGDDKNHADAAIERSKHF